MQAKINEKILSIPPYISTGWSAIASLYMKESALSIVLNDGSSIEIPDLREEALKSVFYFHASYLEKKSFESTNSNQMFFQKQELTGIPEQGNSGLRFGIGSMDGSSNPMEHNPAQSNAPDLPPEVLHKIMAISKILSFGDAERPKAEPSCNCFHCQIANALNPESLEQNERENFIPDVELHFQQWDIREDGQNLYTVINKLDTSETYRVSLGEPLTCTCGKQGCEHIIAVLKT
jgi:hypothetical protein